MFGVLKKRLLKHSSVLPLSPTTIVAGTRNEWLLHNDDYVRNESERIALHAFSGSPLLESDHLEGLRSLVDYLNQFGSQGYFPIISTMFIGQSHDIEVLGDGSSLWPCYIGYSVNYNCCQLKPNPPHSGYSLCLLSSKLVLKPEHTKRLMKKGLIQTRTFVDN